MGISPGVHETSGRPRAGATRGAAARVALIMFLLVAMAGCGTERGAKTQAGKGKGGDTTAAASRAGKARASAAKRAPAARSTAPKPVTRANYVRLTRKGCIAFDPQWTAIPVGQSLTWHNESGATVTVHVAAGAFDREEFVVRAGQNASSGPARRAGAFPVWSEPSACRGVSRGTQGTSPGVTVKGGGRP